MERTQIAARQERSFKTNKIHIYLEYQTVRNRAGRFHSRDFALGIAWLSS